MSGFKDKVVFVTGGTGSFGQAFIRFLLDNHSPKKIIIFSRDELKQFEMQQRFTTDKLSFLLGDVRDSERLRQAMSGVDIVIHAAAMKQVPASERNPMEAIKTNIFGAENIVNVALEKSVDKVIALSTDKAANPANLYGATKLCSDRLFIAANGLNRDSRTKFSVVRYGNVIGSRGSVIPFFRKMKEKNNEVPITDENMTRFWLTLKQGIEFVTQSLELMEGGEIFVPKIPSMNIMDVAKAAVGDCNFRYIGIRPGEKLHEIMITEDDSHNTLEFDNHYVIQPADPWWDSKSYVERKSCSYVKRGFSYSSDKNKHWLTIEELQEMIEEKI